MATITISKAEAATFTDGKEPSWVADRIASTTWTEAAPT